MEIQTSKALSDVQQFRHYQTCSNSDTSYYNGVATWKMRRKPIPL